MKLKGCYLLKDLLEDYYYNYQCGPGSMKSMKCCNNSKATIITIIFFSEFFFVVVFF